jgi:hypothetical protein
MDQMGLEHQKPTMPHKETVMVSVITTSGAYPKKGQEKVSATDLVAEFLREAAKHLRLADTTNWIATFDGREINPDHSFAQNGLDGIVALHWGPREGGGG